MAVLVGMAGDWKGREFPLARSENTIGRNQDNLIILNHPSVSGRHACILRQGGKYTLRDLGSTNGTRLNGRRTAESRLRPKDLIEFGSVELMFNGADVDLEGMAVSSSAARRQVVATSGTHEEEASAMFAFGQRRSGRWSWLVWVIVLSTAALAGVIWLVIQLMSVGG